MSQHEYTPDPLYRYVMQQLHLILDQLKAQSPLPLAGAPEAIANHEGWMKRFDEIVELARTSSYIALLALPPEMQTLYQAIQQQKDHLLNLRESEQKQCHTQEQASIHPVVNSSFKERG